MRSHAPTGEGGAKIGNVGISQNVRTNAKLDITDE
jgi:hypothetical protein